MKKVEKVEKSQSEPLLRGLFAIFSENRRPLVGVRRGFLNVGDPQNLQQNAAPAGILLPCHIRHVRRNRRGAGARPKPPCGGLGQLQGFAAQPCISLRGIQGAPAPRGNLHYPRRSRLDLRVRI